jgi:hypothetical protein
VLAAGGGQYKVERARARRPRGPAAIACDGQRRWKAYPGRVVVGPAAPLRSDVARMIDSAWLLGCRLSGAPIRLSCALTGQWRVFTGSAHAAEPSPCVAWHR